MNTTREDLIQEYDRIHEKTVYQKGCPQDNLESISLIELEWKYTQPDTLVEFLNERGDL